MMPAPMAQRVSPPAWWMSCFFIRCSRWVVSLGVIAGAKRILPLLDERGAFASRAARQHLRADGLPVEPGQIQPLQAGGQGLDGLSRPAAKPIRR